MIEKLQIQNFRGFSELTLEGLKRVNLVVGRNNSGKTSLLQAISSVSTPELIEDVWNAEVESGWIIQRGESNARIACWQTGGKKPCGDLFLSSDSNPEEFEFYLEGLGIPTLKNAAWQVADTLCFIHSNSGLTYEYLPSATAHTLDHVGLFSFALLRRGAEEKIEQVLAEVDPRIKKVRLIKGGTQYKVVLDMGLDELMPLSQAGQGVTNILTIVSLIIGKSPDVCIIDEIENGIHYSALPTFWKGIAAIVENTNTQIFATTHSWECIEAAHEAFSEAPEYDFSIIQLFRVEKRPQGRVLNHEDIEAAIKGEIELR
jgi:hypothetical protein